MRRPVIAGNWKLFKSSVEARELVGSLLPLVNRTDTVDVVVAPVFTVLATVRDLVQGTNIRLAAQDCFWEEEGAFTGEVSPKMLVDAGCSHVIIGHSERRQYFGDTDDTVNKKLKAALAADLIPLFCVGETLEEREADKTFEVIGRQLKKGLAGIHDDLVSRIVIAYEPVWAIGTGKTASNQQAQEVHAFIRSVLCETRSRTIAESTRILYGGSVKPENIRGLMSQTDIDGALVGGASLKAESFASIVNYGG
ncbi:triose-phosphate isomerase [Geobacter sp. DSM 9736]|uniref:triose-phosphate isomerase n=1 Tax=Geobacter sp. DSM 9736 TaxID=1277350 RepID=UPI000B510CFA|nr:triose-phosphate isomerase [Geobacter sp. DSM 9736]SNB45580.1 triosephosphate isomerase [Geobacter sp. DSM 9736]